MNKQQLISAHTLSAVRAAEARWGLASVRHWFQPLRLFPQLGGTAARPAKNITERDGPDGEVLRLTRGERKRAMRKLAIDRLMSGPVASY